MKLLKMCCYALMCVCAMHSIFGEETITPTVTSYVTQLDDEEQFASFIEKAEKPVIVDFFAPWCDPCMQAKPIFEGLAKELKDQYLFASVNVDEAPQIALKYDIESIPTFKIFHNGIVTGTFKSPQQVDYAINQKLTLNTLISAIQVQDRALVDKCLACEEIDVNGIIQMPVMNATAPMSPLMMATFLAVAGQNSSEIFSALLEAGADVDLELEYSVYDASMTLTGHNKASARLAIVEMAKISEEQIAAVENEAIREHTLKCKTNAQRLLEILEASQD